MALLLMPNGLNNINHYYIRFDFSTYTALHVDCGKRTVEAVSIKAIENTPVFVRLFDPYKLHEARVYDSSSFRMVLCFFDRFYVTAGTMQVLEFDSPQAYMEHMRVSLYDAVLFPPVVECQETNPWRTLSRSGDIGAVWLCDFSPVDEGVDPGPGSALTGVLCRLWREVDGSLTLKPARSTAICDAWEENNCSTGLRRLTSVHKRTTL